MTEIHSAVITFDESGVPYVVLVVNVDEGGRFTHIEHATIYSDHVTFGELITKIKATLGLCFWITKRQHMDGTFTVNLQSMSFSLEPTEFMELFDLEESP